MSLVTALNGVRTTLASALTSVATTISVAASSSPWKTPPDPSSGFYYLTLIDAETPTQWERVKVTARAGAGPYDLTVTRNVDSSTGAALAFSSGAIIQWVPGDEELEAYLQRDGSVALTGELQAADNVISRAELKDYAETRTAPTSSAGALTLDLQNGNVFEVTLTENITTLTLSNPPASGKGGAFSLILTQDATGGRTVTWPASVKWAGGTAPTLSTTASAIDVLTFMTTDGGTTWYGFSAGLNMS